MRGLLNSVVLATLLGASAFAAQGDSPPAGDPVEPFSVAAGAAGASAASADGATQDSWGPWYFLGLLAGAIASGVALGYHPISRGKVASLTEMDLPKTVLTYSVVGALVAIVVQKIPLMGFAIFGVGALIRVRTLLPSPKETGRLILATVIGFCWGAGSWDVAIMATVIAWLLVLILDWRVGYRMIVRSLDPALLVDSSAAYQAVLEKTGCVISQLKKNPKKGQVSVVFRASRKHSREDLETAFEEQVEERLRGTVDWPEEG